MKKFKVKTRERLYDRLIRGLTRIIKRKPRYINLNDGLALDGRDLPKQCMLIGNHNGAGGPYSFRTFMKRKRFMIWGTHQMCENYKSRRHYLYHTFYRQKLGWSKPRAKFMSWFFGSFSHIIYAHAGIIPTYTDGRLSRTFKYSFECLEKDVSVFVFPEDSSEGYKEQIEKFWPGFLHFAILYYKRKGEDLPIYTCYYHRKPKTIVIGKPLYIQELLQTNTKEEVLEIFRNYMNSLREYAVDDKKK